MPNAPHAVAKKKKRAVRKIVPRLGPPTNVRPAGAHGDESLYDRKKERADLRRELAEDGAPLAGDRED